MAKRFCGTTMYLHPQHILRKILGNFLNRRSFVLSIILKRVFLSYLLILLMGQTFAKRRFINILKVGKYFDSRISAKDKFSCIIFINGLKNGRNVHKAEPTSLNKNRIVYFENYTNFYNKNKKK